MKKIVLLFNFFLFSAMVYCQTINIEGTDYKIDTLENHQVGPGTQYMSLRLTAGGSKRLDVFFLQADVTNPYIEIHAAIGRDSIYGGEAPSSLAKRKSKEGLFYFAGTNGDFYDTGATYAGYPVSGNMIDGEIAKIPGDRRVYACDAEKKSYIGMMSYAGKVTFGAENWTINSINHVRETNNLKLYNQYNGKYTHTNQYGTEVEIELTGGDTWGVNRTLHAKVTKIEKNIGNMAIPKGKAVLSGHGTSADKLNTLSVGDEIELNLNLTMEGGINADFTQMTGGDNYAKIIENGNVVTTNFWNELHPRTGLGYSQTGDTVVFCVVDGRSLSNGCTTRVLGTIMRSAGAWTAFNMDGGGSSAMYVAEYDGPVNRVSDGYERAVANSIFVVSTAPTDNEIGIIKPYKAAVSLPTYSQYIPHFYGYNRYGTLLDSDLQGVVLSCPASLGTIEGDKFIATGNTSGNITATYNGSVVATIAVEIIAVSEIKIRLDSVIVDNRSDYPIEVLAVTAQGNVSVVPDALSWAGEKANICSWDYGVIKAKNNGKNMLYGQIGDIKDSILVSVEIPSAQTITGDSLKPADWTLSASSFLNAQLNRSNLPAAWEWGAGVNFVHTEGRSPFIKLTNQRSFYGLPDTVKIVMNIGDLSISRAIFTFRANNATATVTKELNVFEKNTDFSLDFPVDQLFDASDRAIYPIWFESVYFYLDASSNTPGTAYTLGIKEIQLAYKDFVITALPTLKAAGFSVFPNPATNIINIRLDDNTGQPIRTEIYSLSGMLMDSRNHGLNRGETITVPLKNLSAGIYLLKVFQGNSTKVCKFAVK